MNVFEYLIRKMDDEIASLEQRMQSGNLRDYAEYREAVGALRAHAYFRASVKEAEEKILADNTDEG